MHSCGGGIAFRLGDKIRIFSSLFSKKTSFGDVLIARGIVFGAPDEKLYSLYSTPDVSYATLMMITAILGAVWHVWRWRVLRRECSKEG